MDTLAPTFIFFTIFYRKQKSEEEDIDNLEVGDDLGDVGVHLVKVGVLGGRLPVLAASHSVQDVLSEKRVNRWPKE